MKLRLGKVLADQKVTQRQLADRIGKSTGFISQLVSGKRSASPATLGDIAKAIGVHPSALIGQTRSIPVVGRVGAGASVALVDAYAKGSGLFRIVAPPDLAPDTVIGVEVAGDSMEPLIAEGDVLLFARQFVGIEPDAIGRVCICETDDGEALVKKVSTGRAAGLFDLYSLNPLTPPRYGIPLRWAAPYRRHIQRRDIETVD